MMITITVVILSNQEIHCTVNPFILVEHILSEKTKLASLN